MFGASSVTRPTKAIQISLMLMAEFIHLPNFISSPLLVLAIRLNLTKINAIVPAIWYTIIENMP